MVRLSGFRRWDSSDVDDSPATRARTTYGRLVRGLICFGSNLQFGACYASRYVKLRACKRSCLDRRGVTPSTVVFLSLPLNPYIVRWLSGARASPSFPLQGSTCASASTRSPHHTTSCDTSSSSPTEAPPYIMWSFGIEPSGTIVRTQFL